MRIALIGQAQFGEAVFNALREAGEQIVAVSSIQGTPERPDPLWAAAEAAQIPVFPTGRLKKANVLEAYSATEPDLCVMAFVTHILPEPVLFAPKHGSIQYHPSLLPRHRGRSAMHWAIRMGDPTTGVTIFWTDKGIDTGPVLLQRECPVGADDTVGSLYFDKMFPMGVQMLAESVRLVREGAAPRITQDEARATYEAPADDGNSAIDWTRPAREVYDLIRGSNPQPGAHAILYATKVRIFDSTLTQLADPEDTGGTITTSQGEFAAGPGTILAASDTQIDIAVLGGILHARRLQRDGSKKLPAGEFAAEMGIEVGDGFENGVPSAAG
ncbi:MAG: methionyl-tRNA formyltransferase [Chloroflexi bacterium]|nr:methionyl-tRNA formyltransferase [Chloroflexota bacterium]